MSVLLVSFAAATFVVRLRMLSHMWSLPLKHGEERFLGQTVPTGFYSEAGVPLLKRFRFSLLAPLLVDAPLMTWLALTQRYEALLLEQWIALLVTIVVYNVVIAQFSYRATRVVAQVDDRPITLQLSMSPRRLRDHTTPAIELAIAGALLFSVALLTYALLSRGDVDSDTIRGGVTNAIWILYLQAGLMLLKVVFVRWRMPLPVSRTEDFRRWRSGWLEYHVKLFDSLRVVFALLLLTGMGLKLTWGGWTRGAVVAALCMWIPTLVIFLVYLTRQTRRLRDLERELKPVEMMKEFPRFPVADGRFLAGGIFYFNRNNPVVLVRGAKGLAINLANTSTYLWLAYFLGLAALAIWMAR